LQTAQQPTGSLKRNKFKGLKLPKNVLVIAGFLAVFWLGYVAGHGNISFGRGNLANENKNIPQSLNYSSVEQVYDTLRKDYDGHLDQSKLLDGLKQGLVTAAGDPYTEYMTSKEAQEFNGELSGTFSGIGAELSKDGNNIVIVSPLAGYPAEKAGLKPKDVLSQIDGKPAANLTVTEAVNKIRGPKGTSVKLTVIRNSEQELNFTVQREDISIPSVESKVLDGNIGYLRISRFGEDTASLSQKAATDFKNQNVKGVIVDLRGDPGGLLPAAVDVSSLWLDNKLVLTERRGGTIIQSHQSKGTPTLKGVPTVVLIDEGSASASEITAGALRDNAAATLIGTKSFGKGSVQQLENLQDGALLKVTIARWYTPKGRNIDKQGIEPDKNVKISDDDIKAGRDPQKDAAIQELSK
jgi:carboxyl-terminal processing protease